MISEIFNVICNSSVFIYTYYNLETCAYQQFVICNELSDLQPMLSHLENVKNQIGFGNNKFDYPLIHNIISCKQYYSYLDGKTLLKRLNNYIEEFNSTPTVIYPKYINQMDLASFTGLSSQSPKYTIDDLKIDMGATDILSKKPGPFEHIKHGEFYTESFNNIAAIKKLYELMNGTDKSNPNYFGKNLLSARYSLCEDIQADILSSTPSGFAITYFSKKYFQLTGKTIAETTNTVQTRGVVLKNIMPMWASYRNAALNQLASELADTKYIFGDSLKRTLKYGDIQLKMGLGGIHGRAERGVYETDETYQILDIDVVSMYAMIAIDNDIRPKSHNDDFTKCLQYIFQKRITAMRKDDDVSRGIVVILKSILNLIYGKTKEENSFLFDPLYSVAIVITAQLFMLKFMEQIIDKVQEVEFLTVNTDGMTIKIKHNHMKRLFEVFDEMKKISPSMKLKIKKYDRFFLRDVNNYFATTVDGDVISKGIFNEYWEIGKTINAPVITKAVKEYLIKNTAINTYIMCADIKEFLYKISCDEKDDLVLSKMSAGKITNQKIQNPNRYYFSKNYAESPAIFLNKYGGKKLTDGVVNLCEKIVINDDRQLNTSYYISLAEKLVADFVDSSDTLPF